MKLILDTCVIIWAIANEERIPEANRKVLTAVDSQIFVSPISAAEIACAVDRGKLQLDRHWKRCGLDFLLN
ncbi:MAG: PIN domain-containing protein [Deltaproteobacteria bacterium]|nr:PIN domain-containing protein [Deltaproteobacteria bacterium]